MQSGYKIVNAKGELSEVTFGSREDAMHFCAVGEFVRYWDSVNG